MSDKFCTDESRPEEFLAGRVVLFLAGSSRCALRKAARYFCCAARLSNAASLPLEGIFSYDSRAILCDTDCYKPGSSVPDLLPTRSVTTNYLQGEVSPSDSFLRPRVLNGMQLTAI